MLGSSRTAFGLRGKDLEERLTRELNQPVVAFNVPHEKVLPDGRTVPGNRPGTVGIPLPGTAVRTVDPESGATLDEALAVRMPPPHSYTREAVVEIHCHGGPVATRRGC